MNSIISWAKGQGLWCPQTKAKILVLMTRPWPSKSEASEMFCLELKGGDEGGPSHTTRVSRKGYLTPSTYHWVSRWGLSCQQCFCKIKSFSSVTS